METEKEHAEMLEVNRMINFQYVMSLTSTILVLFCFLIYKLDKLFHLFTIFFAHHSFLHLKSSVSGHSPV